MASWAGLTVVSPSFVGAAGGRSLGSGRRTDLAEGGYTGNLFLCLHASGGWDPTHLCDAKARSGPNDTNPITQLTADDIDTSLGFAYPAAFNPEEYGDGAGTGISSFFETHGSRLRIINGIDMQTNGHDSGTRYTWSGRLSEGAPTLAAYLAATFDPTLPMAFLTYGGYDETAGVAAQTRAANLDALYGAAYPTRRNATDETSGYHSDRALELIEEAQLKRDMALLESQRLPRIRRSIASLYAARAGSNELKRLVEYIPEDQSQFPDNRLHQSIMIAMAAYQAGITIAVNVTVGGFDTHGNHNQSHVPRLDELVRAIDYAWIESERRGIQDKLVVVVGSDFSRTPGYNEGNGKDHWSVGSMMFMGAGIKPGVVGATDEGHRAYGITPSLEVERNIDAPLKILPGHVHLALRDKYAQGADNPLAPMFPISLTPLPLLG